MSKGKHEIRKKLEQEKWPATGNASGKSKITLAEGDLPARKVWKKPLLEGAEQ